MGLWGNRNVINRGEVKKMIHASFDDRSHKSAAIAGIYQYDTGPAGVTFQLAGTVLTITTV